MNKLNRLTTEAMIKCFSWLTYCRSIGWSESEVPALINLWLRAHTYHGVPRKLKP
jgi:hypothetical protein